MVLFYRNTHTGPKFDQYREDLQDDREILDDEHPRIWRKEGYFSVHMLEHEQGLTFDQLVAKTRQYEQQFLEEPATIEYILEELRACLFLTLIRVEERP